MTTVLIVDDQPDIVRLVRDYLERAGFGVLTAADGEQALQIARSSHPDLVILDLTLPRLDGLDVARALRRDGDVPIIMLTARTEESDRVAGLELGARIGAATGDRSELVAAALLIAVGTAIAAGAF